MLRVPQNGWHEHGWPDTADARGSSNDHFRRGKVNGGLMLKQHALGLRKERMTLLRVYARRLLHRQRVDLLLPRRTGGLLVLVPEVKRPGTHPELWIPCGIKGIEFDREEDRVVVMCLP